MKRVISIIVVMCLIFTGFGILPIIAEDESITEISHQTRDGQRGSILNVGPGQTYTKIQDAIKAANDGDTIRVYAGNYYENIVINKRLTLIGSGSTTTTIDANGIGDVICINTSGVTIDSFTLTNSGNGSWYGGIALYNAKNCSLVNNNVSSNRNFGIFFHQSSNNIIENNNISSNKEPGIYFYHPLFRAGP